MKGAILFSFSKLDNIGVGISLPNKKKGYKGGEKSRKYCKLVGFSEFLWVD